MNMIKLSVFKNRLSGILSVVGIPPVPVPLPEEIQLLMYGFVSSFSFNILSLTDVKA